MPVTQVTAPTELQPNHVYVIAPDANLITEDGHVQPAERSRTKGPSTAIDVFFLALADAHGERAP
jgi:two-component system CheB/CheR fusion protein